MEADNITKSYEGKTLFKNLSFSISKGLMYIQGPSGCGKTTLLNIIMGLVQPDTGKVSLSSREKHFAYAGQMPGFLYHKSLRQNISILGKDNIEPDRVDELCQRLGFGIYLDTPIILLSGGEREKAEIIFALSKKAGLYILDEPYASLDERSKEELTLIINEYAKDRLLILVNHDVHVEGLKTSLVLDFSSGEKIQVLKTGLYEKGPSSLESEKVEFKPSSGRIKAFFADYLGIEKFYSFVKVLLITLMAVFFGLGCSFINTKSPKESLAVSLKADPFSVHKLVLHKDCLAPEDFFGDVALEGHEKIPLYAYATSKFINVLGYLPAEADTFYYYQGQNVNYSCFSSDSHLYQYDKQGNQKTYSVIKCQEDNPYLAEALKEEANRAAFDNGNIKILLASNSFIDSYLTCGGGYLSTDDAEFNPSGVILSSANTAFDPGISFVASGYLMEVQSNDSSVIINDRSGYYYVRPGFKEGKRCRFNNELTTCFSTTDDGTDKENSEMSLSFFKSLLMYSGASYVLNSEYFSYSMDNEGLLDAADKYDDFFNYENIIEDYTMDKVNRQNKDKLFFSLSLVCFAADILLVLLSAKGKKKFSSSISSVYERNGIDSKWLKFSSGLMCSIEGLISLAISIPLYLFAFIRLGNYQMMKMNVYRTDVSYYYYSRQPINSYYDFIKSPIQFIGVEGLFFYIFIPVAILCLINSLVLLNSGKDKKLNKKKKQKELK